jgi:hypothetical protein
MVMVIVPAPVRRRSCGVSSYRISVTVPVGRLRGSPCSGHPDPAFAGSLSARFADFLEAGHRSSITVDHRSRARQLLKRRVRIRKMRESTS